uniref:Uncharacterized protein n=1 Tax=Oryza meridionalis TaxID=40149 RepID=A0A0E0E844_9ORYZ
MDVGERSEDPPRVWAEQDPPKDPEKSKLEKSWDMAQVIYGAILFGSLFYMGVVKESMKDYPATLTTMLIVFGTLWHIYYLIPDKKAAKTFFIVKVTLVSAFYFVMLILVIRKARSNAIAAIAAPVFQPTRFDYDSDSPRYNVMEVLPQERGAYEGFYGI